jgi:hypothetical protein
LSLRRPHVICTTMQKTGRFWNLTVQHRPFLPSGVMATGTILCILYHLAVFTSRTWPIPMTSATTISRLTAARDAYHSIRFLHHPRANGNPEAPRTLTYTMNLRLKGIASMANLCGAGMPLESQHPAFESRVLTTMASLFVDNRVGTCYTIERVVIQPLQ